jgi:hypothetical protein
VSDGNRKQVLRLEIPIESEAELAALEGALISARASELSQMRRRGTRHALGYGSDSARETMTDEIEQAERRHAMLDRLLIALKSPTDEGSK